MPEKWLRCYALMLSRLDAEEHLNRVSEAMAADSWIERRYRQELLNRWQRQVQGPGPAEPERMTEREFRDRMALVGLFLDG